MARKQDLITTARDRIAFWQGLAEFAAKRGYSEEYIAICEGKAEYWSEKLDALTSGINEAA